ncbi:Serine hydrolase [Globisporangium polare]
MATATPTTQKKLRVLCLHGFRTNVQVMQDQTRALRQVLGETAEFTYISGPFEAEGDSDPMIEERYAQPFYEWWRLLRLDGELADMNSSETSARARALVATGTRWYMRFGRLDETLEYMDEQLRKHGPFDVVVGFSQGSVLLTVLSMLYLKNQNKRWWKLAICVCGIRVGAIECRPLFETDEGEPVLVPIPSVHVIGKLDPLYKESHRLVGMYEPFPEGSPTPRIVLEHEEGHKFPSLKHHKAFYDELVRVIYQHCGDPSASTSTQSSKL